MNDVLFGLVRMKKALQVVTGIALTSVLIVPSQAIGDIYIGGGIGVSRLEPDSGASGFTQTDDSDTGFHLFLGKNFSSRIGGEIGFSNLGAAEFSPDGDIDYNVFAVSGLYYAWSGSSDADRHGLSVYGRAGLGRLDNDSDLPFRRVNDLHLLLGAGIEYNLRSGFGGRVEIVSFDEDAQYASISLLYRFGRQRQAVLPTVPIVEKEPVSTATDILAAVENEPGDDWSTSNMPIVFFDTDSVELDEAALVALEELSRFLAAEPELQLSLVGHTDSRGPKQYNARLAKNRALSVARFLVDRDVSIDRIRAYTRGEESLADVDSSADSHASNRRVVIYAVKP